MKKITFEILFSKNLSKSKEKSWFAKEFPTIMSLLEKIKERDHRDLSLILQNMEAEAVLDIATKRIYKYNKEIPIFTIHDSIMTLKKYTYVTKAILQKSIEDITGYTPALSISNS